MAGFELKIAPTASGTVGRSNIGRSIRRKARAMRLANLRRQTLWSAAPLVSAGTVAIAMGLALAWLRPVPRGPWRSVWVTLLASIAVAFSLLLLVGSWTSSPAVSQWMLLTGGETADALLLILIAATVLAYGLAGSKDER